MGSCSSFGWVAFWVDRSSEITFIKAKEGNVAVRDESLDKSFGSVDG